MQSAKAYQKVIVDPGRAFEAKKYIDASSSCFYYWMDNDDYFAKKYEFKHPTKKLKQIEFNTIDRHIAYKKYNAALSGGVYSVSQVKKEACEFDENGFLRD